MLFKMYAIIEACGKQYKVVEGDVVFFEKLDTEEGKKVTFDNVVLVSDDKKVEVGAPYVKGVKVEGKVVSHGKGKKILVYKYKAKKNYRRTQGHRQPYTKVEITKIKTAAEKAGSQPQPVCHPGGKCHNRRVRPAGSFLGGKGTARRQRDDGGDTGSVCDPWKCRLSVPGIGNG